MSTFSNEAQAQRPNNYETDYNMQPGPTSPTHNIDYGMPTAPPVAPSQNAFFSPQAAFYSNPGQGQMPSMGGIPGMEYLSGNPLFGIGVGVVEQGIKNITSEPGKMLPSGVIRFN